MEDFTDSNHSFLTVGWLLADLMLGVAIIFLVAANVSPGRGGNADTGSATQTAVASRTAESSSTSAGAQGTIAALSTQTAAQAAGQSARGTQIAQLQRTVVTESSARAAAEQTVTAIVAFSPTSISTSEVQPTPTPCVPTVELEENKFTVSAQPDGQAPTVDTIAARIREEIGESQVGLLYTLGHAPAVGQGEAIAAAVNGDLRVHPELQENFTSETIFWDGGFADVPYGQVDFSVFLSSASCGG